MNIRTELERLKRLAEHLGDGCPICRGWPPPTIAIVEADDPAASGPVAFSRCDTCGWTFEGVTQIVVERPTVTGGSHEFAITG